MVKRYFDKKSSTSNYKCGDMVLKYNECVAKPRQHQKFDSLWEGLFHINQCKKSNAFELEILEGEPLGNLVSGVHLKPFF